MEKKYASNIDEWADALYRTKTGSVRVRQDDPNYTLYSASLNNVIKKYEESMGIVAEKKEQRKEKGKKPRGKPKLQSEPELEIPGVSGSGLNPTTYHDSQICPDSIVKDVSRLEVLMGGRSAGNNSDELINEAADIAQRLFQNKIIDLHVYREFIDDLMENSRYRGYYSD